MSEQRNSNDYQEKPIKFTKSKTSKLITAISNTDNPKYLFENLNKLFLMEDEGEQFLINLFFIKPEEQNKNNNKNKNDNSFSFKLKELLYFLIINFNFYFFDNFTSEKQLFFSEEEFINECFKKSSEIILNRNYNNIYGTNNNLLFHKYFCIISYFLLR